MAKQTTKYVAHTNLHKRDMQFKKRDLVLIRINSVTSKKVSPWHLWQTSCKKWWSIQGS